MCLEGGSRLCFPTPTRGVGRVENWSLCSGSDGLLILLGVTYFIKKHKPAVHPVSESQDRPKAFQVLLTQSITPSAVELLLYAPSPACSDHLQGEQAEK